MREEAHLNLVALRDNTYPGRGIIIGKDPTGEYLIQVYWLLGRSEGSRNRVLRHYKGLVFTEVADKSKEVGDPKLTLYNAMTDVRHKDEDLQYYVVSNGFQTGDIATGIYAYGERGGFTPVLSNRNLQYEPDASHTPRIAAMCRRSVEGLPMAEIAILRKSQYGDVCERQFFAYDDLYAGYGYCITTYMCDGDPLPTFRGEPYLLPLNTVDVSETARWLWEILNPKNRVSLAVKYIEIKSGESTVHIINKHQ